MGRIRAAVVRILDRDGYDALSMRAVATELDTGQASLYAHVRGRADLDRIVMGHVLGQLPPFESEDWAEHLRAYARDLYAALRAYPGVARAYYVSSPADEQAMARPEAASRALAASGMSMSDALAAVMIIDDVTVGTVMRDDTLDGHAAAAGVTNTELLRMIQARAAAMPDSQRALREQVLAMPVEPRDRQAAFHAVVERAIAGIRACSGLIEDSERRPDAPSASGGLIEV